MNTVTSQNQKGFTLVEIAIVLVIIGLLLGGVLKGQELITNSKIKSVTQDLEGVTAAYYAYQDRTGVLPGDTDETGRINDTADFWQDLRREGFISGTASEASGPTHALDGRFYVATPAAGAGMFGGRNYICVDNVENRVAEGMDNKLDDGEGNTGVIRTALVSDGSVPLAGVAYNQLDTLSTVCKEL